jgi:hypothetical protein
MASKQKHSFASNSSIECPVCLEEPENAPILQCVRGHIICKECYPKLVCCPLCRVKIAKITTIQENDVGAIRSIVAEKLLLNKNKETDFMSQQASDIICRIDNHASKGSLLDILRERQKRLSIKRKFG